MAGSTSLPSKQTISGADILTAVVKGSASAIPVVGGVISEIFGLILEQPLRERQQQWINRIAEDIRVLQERDKKVGIQKLSENAEFVSILLTASRQATLTHQEEKLEALANLVSNAAIGMMPEYNESSVFLNLLSRFTSIHLAVLSIFSNPRINPKLKTKFENSSTGSLSHVLEYALPELQGRRAIYDQIWRDLSDAGLVESTNLHMGISGNGMMQSQTTELGRNFLKFISKPEIAK